MIRWIGIACLLAAGAFALYAMRPDAALPPIDFTDDLKGPASPHLTIPFEAYSLTPEGLRRSKAATGRTFGNDRVMVRTKSSEYLTRDFVLEVDLTIPRDTEDLAYVGFGLGDPNPAYNAEPAGAFQFRIHSLPGMNRVDASASLPSSNLPAGAGPKIHASLVPIGSYIAGTTTTFRIERAGNRVTLSMLGNETASHTFDMSLLPALFGEGEGYLFFGNSAEGTIFSNVRVRPRG